MKSNRNKGEYGDYGVSPLIGMILALGIIVGFIGIVQNFFVPEWMKAEEWDHYQLVSSEFSYLAKMVTLSSSTGSPNTVTIDMGVKHSNYPFLLTPPDTASFLEVRRLHINITYYEVYPNGTVASRPKTLDLNTSAIILKPDYVYLDDVEFIYEHGYAFKRYRNANVTLTDQNMIIGDTVNIYIINTTFDSLATTQPLNLVFSPLSYGGVISVANATIRFESLNPDYWASVGADISGNIVQINVTNARLKIAAMVITPSGNNMTAPAISQQLELVPLSSQLNLIVGETEKVQVMARDQFGNPVSGVTVNASVNGFVGNIGNLDRTSVTTDVQGVATFYFTATNEGQGTIDFEAQSKQASIPVRVVDVNASAERQWDQNTFNTSVIISPDFIWTDIYGASKIILKNAKSITGEDPREFEIEFVIHNDTTFYLFRVDWGGSWGMGPHGGWSYGEVALYRNGNALFVHEWESLNSSVDAWEKIFEEYYPDVGTDLLNETNYDVPSHVRDGLQEVRDFLYYATPDNPVNLVVQRIESTWKVEIQII